MKNVQLAKCKTGQSGMSCLRVGSGVVLLAWLAQSTLAQSTLAQSTLAQPEVSTHFITGSECAQCHALSNSATAMRDGQNRNVAPYDLWSGSMMAHSAVDPYWRAVVSAEIVATPSQKPHIEEVCSRCHAPMASPIAASPDGQVLGFLSGSHAKAALGKDGVSCTVCHQIQADNLGTDDSFTGGFVFNQRREIYGPHANPVTMPMQRHVGYTPTKGDHILSSALCATCHTVITESFDKQGTATHVRLHEQAPYLEWRNSVFNDELDSNRQTAKSCQSCHVPQTDVDGKAIASKLAHNPGGRDFPFLSSRLPIGRHTFAGGNVFMTQLLRDNRHTLAIATPVEAFDRVIRDSRRLLQQDTARLSIIKHRAAGDASTISVQIDNLSGHKFPTAYPSRRAWLEIVVRDDQGTIVFESGRFNATGQIVDDQGRVLASELADGPIQPHHITLSSSQQVQIFETLMEDTDGDLTFALLRGSRFRKDNRLLPLGWTKLHAHAEATRPVGTDYDSNFVAGSTTAHFRLSLPSGCYKIDARLLFQSLSSRYIAELLKVDTPEVTAFASLYSAANLTPEIISSATEELMVP